VKNSNPFNAPGSPIAKLQPRSDAKPKLIMLAVVAATVLLFSGLFIQGCQRQPATNAADADTSSGNVPSGNATGVAEPSAAAPTNVASATPPDAAAASNAMPTNPFATDTAASAPPPGPTKDYTVVKGDSFYKIAKANHITMAALTAANPGVDSAKLKLGQTLHLPVAADAPSASSAPAAVAGAGSVPPDSAPAQAVASSSKSKTSGAKASSGGTKYVVKKGDTLGKIAKAHGTTVKAIKLANGLSSDQISVGKTIKLPGKTSV
jgi:LysM repeat protein